MTVTLQGCLTSSAFSAAIAPCQGSAPNAGSQATLSFPMRFFLSHPRNRTTVISAGARPISSRSRNKRDTVDLLERGLAFPDGFERRVAQEARAGVVRRLLQRPQRGARGDQFAQLVGENHQLGDRLAPLVARSAALPAAAAYPERPALGIRLVQAGFRQKLGRGVVVFGAMRANHAHQALREDGVQRGDET